MENKASQFVSINEKKGTPDNPLVSIITPALNGIKYLEICIQSVLNQSYPHIEHLFVDPHEPGARLFLYHGELSDGAQLSSVSLLPRRDSWSSLRRT